MTNPLRSTKYLADPGCLASIVDRLARKGPLFMLEIPSSSRPKRRRRPRTSVPGGLLTAAQAAAKLGISVKTLNGYVELGALKYIPLGHGKQRQRRMFTDAALNEFITVQTRK